MSKITKENIFKEAENGNLDILNYPKLVMNRSDIDGKYPIHKKKINSFIHLYFMAKKKIVPIASQKEEKIYQRRIV